MDNVGMPGCASFGNDVSHVRSCCVRLRLLIFTGEMFRVSLILDEVYPPETSCPGRLVLDVDGDSLGRTGAWLETIPVMGPRQCRMSESQISWGYLKKTLQVEC